MRVMNRIITKIADRKFWSPYLTSVVVILIALFLTRCFDIISFEQPETAIAGETISIKLDIEVLEDKFNPGNVSGTMPVVGFLVPKSWNVGANTVINITSEVYNSTMSPMIEGAIEGHGGKPWSETLEFMYGTGENYDPTKMEWVMFMADVPYDHNPAYLPIYGTVNIETVVGPDNITAQLGYFIGENDNGIWELNQNQDFRLGTCIEITGGDGVTVNYCGPAPSPGTAVVTPDIFSYNDLLKIDFDASIGENDKVTKLSGASFVYLCAEATLSDGTTISVCDKSDKTALKFIGDDIWQFIIWPNDFFDLEVSSEITEITYNFQDQNGSNIVKDFATGEDFILAASCR